ncbi:MULTISPECIES: metallophosphoesterase [unclassified Lacrimispora]|uniref:metallophosphoesterase n=1 Tax=unclassified Lacrimispora TaxID=2719232 RepID=UPI00376FF72A
MGFAAVALCAAVGAGLYLRSEYEKEQLVVERTVLESAKIKADRTIVFLSDLHEHRFGDGNERLLAAVDEAAPDLVLIGGDMIVSKGKADMAASLELMGKLAGKYPVFCGNGNHENRLLWEPQVYGDSYETYMHSLKKLGIRILDSRTEWYGEDIAVTGIDLEPGAYRKFRPDRLKEEEMEQKVGKASKERFQILLCHSPLYFSSCRSWGADLTLSGHFHGGTIRLPYLGGVMTPQYQFFLPYCAGEFKEDGKHMIVSRGLGTHSINIRLNNKPQVVVVDLKMKS